MDAALADVPAREFRAPRQPVEWATFTSQFADRIVESVTAPEITLEMPKPKPAATTAEPVETAPVETAPPATTAPVETAPPPATTAAVP
ncbi:MAG: hypothetical protein ACKO7U_11070, partial [Actinomycetota bacterium]